MCMFGIRWKFHLRLTLVKSVGRVTVVLTGFGGSREWT